MTHEERIEYLKSLPGETITPKEAALVLGGNPYAYNVAAKQGVLTLPYIWHGRNLKLFKQPIISILEGKVAIVKRDKVRDDSDYLLPNYLNM